MQQLALETMAKAYADSKKPQLLCNHESKLELCKMLLLEDRNRHEAEC